MLQTDMSVYNATRDRAGGPLIIEEDAGVAYQAEPYRDESGKVTKGGWIGYFAGYAIIAGGILYCMYLF